ncbi:hypothetical protein [Hyphobacterium sp.]|uniref:hypothetical protein n=1 Tax=Hyphobacterium sp. TaxID=2004662 RepID=UPI003B528D69
MLGWFKTNHQALTAIGAMVVGLAALYVAWDQARVMRAQQHGAVVPALQVDAFTRSEGDRLSIGLRVANNGVGPAMVRNVQVIRDGEPTQAIEAMFTALPSDQLDRSWVTLTGRVIAPGELVTPISVDWRASEVGTDAIADLFAEWERWDIEICYCSVFDRCWIATVQVQDRRQVASCPDPGQDVFELYGSETFLMPRALQDETSETAGAEE